MIVTATMSSLAPKSKVLTRVDDLLGKRRRIHVEDCSSHMETLPSGSIVRRSTICPRRVGSLAQLAVVEPVKRRLVAVEHDLNFFVGAAGDCARSQRSVEPALSPAPMELAHATDGDAINAAPPPPPKSRLSRRG